jgi:hypothetical protein
VPIPPPSATKEYPKAKAKANLTNLSMIVSSNDKFIESKDKSPPLIVLYHNYWYVLVIFKEVEAGKSSSRIPLGILENR